MMRFLPLLLHTFGRTAGANLLRQQSPLDLSQWNFSHEADATQPLQVTIALTIQNADLGVKTLLRISDPSSPDYGQHLSAEDVARTFAPRPNNVPDVMKWLRKSGVDQSNIRISHGGGHLTLDLSVQEATLLLQTTFYRQTHQGTGQEQIACQHYHIPESLAGSIDYIVAASPIRTHRQIPRQQVVLNDEVTALAPLPTNCFTQTTLSCLRVLYGIPENVLPHPNNSFGVFEPSWFSWRPEDLDEFFRRHQPNRVGHRPKVDAVNGGYLQRNRSESYWYTEADLDFEYAMGLTSPQEVTNIQVGSELTGNLYDMLAAFDEYFCDPSGHKEHPGFWPPGCNTTACDCGSMSPPKVLSISWGWTEDGFTAKYLERQCLEFLKLGLMGTTVVVSVSDHGTASMGFKGPSCIDDTTENATGGRFSPTFPSTCPWVTTVGGTQMLQRTSRQAPAATTNETVFRQMTGGTLASSGGGFSNVFAAPPYQGPHVAMYKDIEKDHLDKIRDHFSSTGRGYPDVAARADEYLIVVKEKWGTTSGTSASNPVFASIITLLNSERMHTGKASVGFINPVLYSNPDILNDVQTGANQGCGVDQAFRATRGWDAVTGLGSPDYERMRRLFMSLP